MKQPYKTFNLLLFYSMYLGRSHMGVKYHEDVPCALQHQLKFGWLFHILHLNGFRDLLFQVRVKMVI